MVNTENRAVVDYEPIYFEVEDGRWYVNDPWPERIAIAGALLEEMRNGDVPIAHIDRHNDLWFTVANGSAHYMPVEVRRAMDLTVYELVEQTHQRRVR